MERRVVAYLSALAADGLNSLPPEIGERDTFIGAPSTQDAEAVVDRVINANQSDKSIQIYRNKAIQKSSSWSITDDRLLLYKGRLMVPEIDFLRVQLIRAIHAAQITAHPGTRKTAALLREKYY